MKMEILTVQNHMMPSIKVKGSNWTPATLTPPKSTKAHQEDDDDLFHLPTFNEEAIQQVAEMLTNTLRDAKQRHLSCTEVLLPCELLQRIGVEMLISSDEEACGIRGCNIIIEFEDEMGNKKKIASTKTDPNTVSTFELILTLKQDRSGWTSILPQFLKNLTRGGTIMISRDYLLVKNKLNYSFE